jgi:hypothetical protein
VVCVAWILGTLHSNPQLYRLHSCMIHFPAMSCMIHFPAMSCSYVQFIVSKGDCIIFKQQDDHVIGKILCKEGNNSLSVLIFTKLCTEQLLQYSLSRPSATEFPRITTSGIFELLLTPTTVVIERSLIEDIAFMSSLNEAECGFFHLSGADNALPIGQ